jgi:hypothetical protein
VPHASIDVPGRTFVDTDEQTSAILTSHHADLGRDSKPRQGRSERGRGRALEGCAAGRAPKPLARKLRPNPSSNLSPTPAHMSATSFLLRNRPPIPPAAKRNEKAATITREGSKTEQAITLMKAPGGTTLKALMEKFGWQAHSVRGFISGTLTKKMGLTVVSTKGEDGQRKYTIA